MHCEAGRGKTGLGVPALGCGYSEWGSQQARAFYQGKLSLGQHEESSKDSKGKKGRKQKGSRGGMVEHALFRIEIS